MKQTLRSPFSVLRFWLMTINFTVASFFSNHGSLNAQQAYSCLSPGSSQNFACGYECFGKMPSDEIALMPMATISVDFHFVRSGGYQFQCSDANAPFYAPVYVAQILGLSNDYFTNPDPNQKSPAPVIALTDTRFRIELIGNPSDPCDAIFLHDVAPTTFSNPNAMHIIIVDDDTPTNVGGSSETTKTYLYNIHANHGLKKQR